MDLVELKKLVEKVLARGHDGEPLMALWARQRECSWKRPAFLRVIMQTETALFLAQFKDKRTLDKSFRFVISQVKALANSSLSALRRESFYSIKDFFGEDTEFLRFRKTQAECRSFIQRVTPPQPELFSNGPPMGFVPLPDAEIGGCARNDSLIALASN